MTPTSSSSCPSCHQRAPIVLRGLSAQCAACGGSRMPFATTAVNLAGKPARVGGLAAKVVGVAVLVVGLSMALGAGLLLHTFFPSGYAGLAVSLPMAIMSLAFGLALLLGGRKLSRSGDDAERSAQHQAIRALAAHRGGVVTATDVAQALSLPTPRADALLTELARQPAEQVSLDLDDDGAIHYLFGVSATALRFARLGARIASPAGPSGAQPVDAEQAGLEQQPGEQRRGKAGPGGRR